MSYAVGRIAYLSRVAPAVLEVRRLLVANTALVYFTLAELRRSGTPLFHYRRGL